jgi:putative hemolysin
MGTLQKLPEGTILLDAYHSVADRDNSATNPPKRLLRDVGDRVGLLAQSAPQAARRGGRSRGAALELADSPNRFLSNVQIGISLIGVLAGAFGGATLAEPLADALRVVPALAPYAGPIAFGTVVIVITYLSLILGELVPKRLALNGAEAAASRVAGPMRQLSVITSPAVWYLSFSTETLLRLLGVRPPLRPR